MLWTWRRMRNDHAAGKLVTPCEAELRLIGLRERVSIQEWAVA